MLKRLCLSLMFISVCASAAYSVEDASMPANMAPDVREINGSGTITLAPVLTHTYKGSCAHLFPSNQPIAGSPTAPTLIPDLVTTVKIPENYRKTAKILVNWSIRVEGACKDLSQRIEASGPYAGCSGTTEISCPKGDVKSYLYVNGEIKEPPYVIEVPGGQGGKIDFYPPPPPPPPPLPHDPTLTGSYMIKPSDFGGTLPAELKLQVSWRNFTSMDITSPDGLRNLIVHVMPVVKE